MQSPRLAVECSLLSLNHNLLNIRESLAKWSVKGENQGESSKQIYEYQQRKSLCFPGVTTGNGTGSLRAVSAISERQKFLTTGRSGGKLKLSFWKWAWLVGWFKLWMRPLISGHSICCPLKSHLDSFFLKKMLFFFLIQYLEICKIVWKLRAADILNHDPPNTDLAAQL